MKDADKTKAQLIQELEQLRLRVTGLEGDGAASGCRGDDHLYREMVEHANDIIYTLSPDGKFTYVSPNWTEILGHPTSEVIGKDFGLFVHPDDLERCGAFLVSLFETGQRQGPVEYRVRHKDGEYRCHTSNAALLDAPDGSMVFVGIARDITERKKAEEAMRASEAMLSSVLDNSSTVIFIKDLDGKYLLINKCYEDLFHITREEILGKTDFDIFPAEAARQFQDKDRRALERGPIEEEELVPQDDGTHAYVSVKFPLLDTEGVAFATCGIATDITARKHAEQELQRAHDELERRVDERTREIKQEKAFIELALNALPGLFYIFDAEGRFKRWNSRFGDVTGYSDEEIARRRATEYFSGEDLGNVVDSITETLEKGEGAVEASINTKAGELLPFYFSGKAAKIENEMYVVGMGLDISDRKKAQEALEGSERRFRGLAESTTAHICIMQDDHYIYANQAFLDYYDLEVEDLPVILPEDLMMGIMGPDLVAQAKPAWEAAMASGASNFSFEYQDLERSWFKTHVTMMELDGKPAFMTTNYDITEIKRAHEEIAESARRYRTIFDTAGTGMISFGDDSVITLANEEWSKLTGYSVEETVGKLTWVPFFTEKSLAKMKEYHKLRSEDPTKAPSAYEAQLKDRAGMVHDGIVNIQIVPGTRQRVASFLDMTELKRAQRQMYRADKMAALGQIIAGVAHEINNPNNFIFFNLPILRRYVEAMCPLLERGMEQEPDRTILNMPYDQFLEDMYKLLENMEHGSRRITSIVSDLKTYIRSGEDREMKTRPLKPVIDQVMALVGKQVRKMVRLFDTDVADPLPPVKINPGKLEQVLINLVINAGQAADKDDSKILLSAQPDEEGRFVEIHVEDNGVGIPEEVLDQIFEPFFTSKGREEGTGLGLSISHQIIQDHGGELTVKSEVGKGTRFTVRLPVPDNP